MYINAPFRVYDNGIVYIVGRVRVYDKPSASAEIFSVVA